ncbi:MAG: hypothetical protein VKK04_03245 [Synechococcales bacterium]|nr:hypothetical protein [Synechococcales bacterium]
MTIKTLRSAITSRLPEPLVLPARRAARTVDQLMGLPLSPWRQGSIVMFHISRCGSTVLGNLLNQHPQIYWDGEVLYKKREFDRHTYPNFDVKAYLERQMLIAGNRYYGFEMKIHSSQQLPVAHTDLTGFVRLLLDMGISHYIRLQRKNYLRVILSKEIAKVTRQWHLQKGAARPTSIYLDTTSIPFGFTSDRQPLLDCLEEMDRAYRELDAALAGQSVLSLTYEEDIAQNPKVAYERCCQFIGLKPADVEVAIRRTNPFPLADLIENFSEVEQLLAPTPYVWMVYD